MEIYTIGFTQTTAESFFGRLRESEIYRLVDVRLNNSSQLSGFAKAKDLPYFLQELIGATYEHEPLLAPNQAMLDSYKKQGGSWETYERQFLALMRERSAADRINRESFNQPTALLCSEATAEHCHRRLVCEYLNESWGEVNATHL